MTTNQQHTPEVQAHTPGPWQAHPGGHSPAGLKNWDILAETGAVAKCYTGLECDGHGTTEANAFLMAAAPDLKSALKLHLAFLESLRKSNPGWLGKLVADIGLLNDAYLASSKALAKATGRDS